MPRSARVSAKASCSWRALFTHSTSSKSRSAQLLGVRRRSSRPGRCSSTRRRVPTSESTWNVVMASCSGMVPPSSCCWSRRKGPPALATGTLVPVVRRRPGGQCPSERPPGSPSRGGKCPDGHDRDPSATHRGEGTTAFHRRRRPGRRGPRPAVGDRPGRRQHHRHRRVHDAGRHGRRRDQLHPHPRRHRHRRRAARRALRAAHQAGARPPTAACTPTPATSSATSPAT